MATATATLESCWHRPQPCGIVFRARVSPCRTAPRRRANMQRPFRRSLRRRRPFDDRKPIAICRTNKMCRRSLVDRLHHGDAARRRFGRSGMGARLSLSETASEADSTCPAATPSPPSLEQLCRARHACRLQIVAPESPCPRDVVRLRSPCRRRSTARRSSRRPCLRACCRINSPPRRARRALRNKPVFLRT